jgi:Zn ribbon nucleic-acid-binding protein
MAERLWCPECGSGDAYCNGKNGAEHNHSCVTCGHQMHESMDDYQRALVEHEAAALDPQAEGGQ